MSPKNTIMVNVYIFTLAFIQGAQIPDKKTPWRGPEMAERMLLATWKILPSFSTMRPMQMANTPDAAARTS